MAGGTTVKRTALTADLQALRSAHPHVFRPSLSASLLRAGLLALVVGLFVYSVIRLDIAPERILKGFAALGHFVTLMFPPSADTWAKFMIYLHALGETVAIALLGTFMAALVAFPLSFLASRNVMPVWPLRFFMRRASDVARGIDQLIWALIWVGIVGLGPMAGVLAIAVSDFGTFVKLFSEAIETADRKPAEGIASTGGNGLEVLRFGVVPQVLPVIAGQALYLFESNVRSSTIIGIVGAGGIGLHLSEQIRTLEWQHVSLLIIMILVAVAVTDFIATRLRRSISGRSGEAALVQ
ncbi:MAG: phosphonate ABC transporter, permease protein PhnE [Hyphomicrobiaceae bacterium]|nr:phosphonate ABC transporter, permease protein PhnE [Hyphomicrobiaceae bacterium]